MTIQQEATDLIYHLPDKNVQLLVELMRTMLSPAQNTAAPLKPADPSKRIGLGKGIINDPEGFDKWDLEVADLLEGTGI
ncbi:MAG: hypothetical protein K2N87_15925 [Eubacterium sp.]|nr:hypothetical protein [Eubacterium sp.]